MKKVKYLFRWLRVMTRYRLNRYDILVRRGIIASLIFLTSIFVLSLFPVCKSDGCEMRLVNFLKSPANEIGDTFAGVAGALAFFWIIVTVMLQSKELREQRKELRLSRREYAAMAGAMQKQADVAGEQLENLKVERRLRQEAEAKDAIAALIDNLGSLVRSKTWEAYSWRWNGKNLFNSDVDLDDTLFRHIDNSVESEVVVRDLHKKVERLHSPLVKGAGSKMTQLNRITLMPEKTSSFLELIETCRALVELTEKLSFADQIRFRAYNLDITLKMLKEMRDASIWSNET